MPSRDQFTTEIYVNGDQARDAMADLGKQLDKLKNQYANLNKNSKNYESRERELAKQIQATEKALATAEKGTESYGRAMENLSKRSINNLIKLQRQLNSEIKKLDPNDAEFKKLSENYQRVTQRIKDLEAAQKGISTGGGVFKKAATWASNYFGALMIGYNAVKRLASGFMDAYKVISNFEQANANLASILGATSEQMEVLEKDAIRLGSSTRYSASQVTGLQTELAKLGFTVKEITDMSPAVLNFAGSVGTDLASAASLAGVALRSFNLGSEQTEDALGTMAVACNKSALSFEYLQNAFSTIAPVAKTYGLSLKDTIALLGTLANAGFDASSAATATRNILLNLSDTNGKLAKALGGSVHSFEDITGAMKKLRDQGVDLNQTLELTDKRSVAAFNTFLDGAESAQTLRDELEDVNGELQRMAEQRANTVEGAIDGMKSAWEGLVLSFRNSTGIFSKVFKTITQGINGLRDLIDPEGTIETRAAQRYSEMFRNIGNEFISIEETRVRVWQKYQELEQSIRDGGGSVIYKKHALEGLKQAYNAVMPELTEMATEANAKVLEINTEYSKKEDDLYKKRAALLEKNSNAAQTKEWANIENQIEANRKAWDQAIEDATRFKKKMDEIVSGDDTKGSGGKGGGGGLTDKELAKQKQAYNKKKAMFDAALNYEEKQLKLSLLQKEITEEEYNTAIKEKKAQYYEDVLALAKKYGQDDSAILASMLDDQIKDLEDAAKKAAEAARKAAKEAEDAAKKEMEEWEKKMKELEELEMKAQEVRDKLRPKDKINRDYENELQNLEDLHAAKLISEQDYLDAVEKLHKEHNKALLDEDLASVQEYVDQVNNIMAEASNFISSLKDAELAKVKATYQAELSAAGNNAEQREAVELAYQKKNLEVQKKYADVEMVINIARTIADGIVAAMKAIKDYGVIAGGVMAGLILASSAASVVSIVAQRNAIKNASVDVSPGSYPSSGSGDGNTGTRTITGYSEGGNTKHAASDSTVVGVVHANEWVAPAWMVRENPTVFADLEQYRRTLGRSRMKLGRGFAGGGFAEKTSGGIDTSISKQEFLNAIKEGAKDGVKEGLQGEYINAIVQYGDILIAAKKHENFKKQTTR